MKNISSKKKIASHWFKTLQDQICEELQNIETKHSKRNNKFKKTKWYRDKKGTNKLGGGEMRLLRGDVFEKAGVNVSTVYGNLAKPLAGKLPGTEKSSKFWASGISLVIHPMSPKIPAIHMNTRLIITEKLWFGGGIDITPSNKKSFQSKKLATFFHNELKKTCDNYKKGCYRKYKKWCDNYFFLPHRNEMRGIGGIFFDYLNSGVWEADMKFIENVGKTFTRTYKEIVGKTVTLKWNSKDKQLQYHRRSRYVEFNLLYDRGTKFGLETNGNVEAILMSLPPLASW